MLQIFYFPIALLYSFSLRIFNLLYDYNILKSTIPKIKTISIGNLTMGGTGKTPHCEFLYKLLLKNEYTPAIFSRGYKRTNKTIQNITNNSKIEDVGDEPLLMFSNLKSNNIWISKDRLSLYSKLDKNIDLVLLDDGYQHRKILPQINILLSDIHKPFFKDYFFPLGFLRDNRDQYKRADIIIFTNNIDVDNIDLRKKTESKFNILPHQKVLYSSILYDKPKILTGDSNELIEKRIIIVTAIANPKYFYSYLSKQYNIINHFKYIDHYNFKEKDIYHWITFLKNNNLNTIFTTQKDSIRLKDFYYLFEQNNITLVELRISIYMNDNDKDILENYCKT